MTFRWLIPLAAGLAVVLTAAAGEPKRQTDQPAVLAAQVAAVKRDHQERETKFYDELRAAKDNAAVTKANQDYQAYTQKAAEKLKALIKEHPEDPAAFGAILVLVGDLRYSLDEATLPVVLKHHLADPRMGQLCFQVMYYAHDTNVEKLLRDVAEKHPARAVRGQAQYALGMYYRNRVQALPGKLTAAEEAKQLAAAERCFREVEKDYAAVTTPDGKARLGDRAAGELARIKNLPNLKVGKPAPEIVGKTLDGRPMKLSDWRGKVVVLDFWGNW